MKYRTIIFLITACLFVEASCAEVTCDVISPSPVWFKTIESINIEDASLLTACSLLESLSKRVATNTPGVSIVCTEGVLRATTNSTVSFLGTNMNIISVFASIMLRYGVDDYTVIDDVAVVGVPQRTYLSSVIFVKCVDESTGEVIDGPNISFSENVIPGAEISVSIKDEKYILVWLHIIQPYQSIGDNHGIVNFMQFRKPLELTISADGYIPVTVSKDLYGDLSNNNNILINMIKEGE